MRARISLGEGIPHENAPSRLWWPLPSPPLPVSVFLSQLLAALHDPPLSASQVTVSLDGFNILHNTTTELLRDGDLLQIELADGARAAAPGKKRKQPESSPPQAPAAQQPKTKTIKGGLDSSKVLEKKDAVAPEAAPERPPPSSEKRPSRSARRKAAKRKWRRLGFPTLPFINKKPQKGKMIETSPENATQATKAKGLVEKDATSDSSTSSDSESEEKTSKSSDTSSTDTSSDSSSASDSSTSNESSDEEEDVPMKIKEVAAFRRVTEEEFKRLAVCVGVPVVDQIVAYTLLEIGDDCTPQVSRVRMGKVTAVDATAVPVTVTLEPYPDASGHPLAYKIAEREAYIEEGEEEVEFATPSRYDEQGMLTTELSSFVDLRCYIEPGQNAAQATQATQAGIKGQELAQQPIAQEIEHLGPSSYSKVGPPRPVSMHVASPTSWAFLAATLQKRRTELSTPSSAAPLKEASKKDKNVEEVVPTDHAATLATAPQTNGKPPSGTAAVTNSRGRKRGSLHSALGPMLRMLRSSKQLE